MDERCFRLRLLAVVHVLAIWSEAAGSPAWMPQLLSGGHGRSIRHLPCVSRRTGEQGICMFAYTCLKSNGTHLGTCIDRFYFGSCCKLEGGHDDLLVESHFPVISSNQVTSPQSEVETTAATTTTDKAIVDLAQHLATETYFLTPSTEKYFVPVQTARPNKTSTTATTEPYLLSTFQVVQGVTGTSTTTSSTTTTTTTTTTTVRPATAGLVSTWTPPRRTTTPSTPKRNSTVTYATIRPPTTNKKPAKPAKPYTKPSTKRPSTTTKPTPPPKKPTKKPTTGKPTSVRPSNATSSTTTTTTTKPTTTSEVVFTKPGLTTIPSYGITTFRPDLATTASGLTTFSYVSDTTLKPTAGSEATEWFGSTLGENRPYGPVLKPSSKPTTAKPPAESSVPFFPETHTQWVEMVQTTVKPSPSPATTTTTTTTTTTSTTTTLSPQMSTMMSILEGLNQSDYTQVCGRRMYPQARVVGGEKSTFGKWPWQISLRQWRTSTYLHKCGAALLNENWAITAAHCVENVPPSDLLLRLGEHDLSTEDEPFGFQERRVQIVASHPQFDPRTFEYDLALLRFYEPVKFQPNIIPVCVPEDNTNFVGQTAYVTGWGRLYEDGPLPSILQEVSVPVINNTLCENMYRSAGYIEHIPEIFICAGWKKGGFDSCEGDSGGPMVIQRPDKRWLLAGVISWGIGCAEPNQPGVYTRISEFREWIHQILQF